MSRKTSSKFSRKSQKKFSLTLLDKGHTVMSVDLEKNGVPTKQVQELMDIMDWSRTQLAANLHMTANAIDKWFGSGKVPGGPVSILLTDWLIRARRGEPLRASESKEMVPA